MTYPTIIIRHTRENVKKCSLRGLEQRSDMLFFTYPDCALGKQQLPDLSHYVVLSMDGEELSAKDAESGIILIDGTWRLAQKILDNTKEIEHLPRRTLPSVFRTSYPRRQDDCPDPETGLASIEALYITYLLTKKDPSGLLDHYYWKDQFLKNNANKFLSLLTH